MIDINSLEIFKIPNYKSESIGSESVDINTNAYLSIVVTNNCQKNCSYCINNETDKSLNLNIYKAIDQIQKLVKRYHIKEAILLGGEPLMHPNLFELIKQLREDSGLEFIRLTTNGILLNNETFIKQLVDKNRGIQGINISYHNNDFINLHQLKLAVETIKKYNSNIKIRINTNIWKNNLDNLKHLLIHINKLNFVDEIRISNIIPKDSFSVNSINHDNDLILFNDEYEKLFNHLINHYSNNYTIIKNDKTLGFVKYVLIPTKIPIIINWNLDSDVSLQACENISNKKINTFKCLVSGDISLSWNKKNIITI
jgi:molybdenum cofactor biosynthesis enzyme MoaA